MSPSDAGGPGGPLVLGFDTSAAHCAAALVRGERLVARRVEPMERGQAERLLPMLEELLAEAGVAWGDLDAIGVCVGPGNFTGLRIAVAAARGLAFGLGAPAVGVTRLEALAEGVAGEALVAVDAKRGAVYAQGFRDGAALSEPALRPVGELDALAPGAARIGAAAAPGSPTSGDRADPEAVARIAARRLGGPIAPPKPLYLRPADADPPSEAPPRILDDA